MNIKSVYERKIFAQYFLNFLFCDKNTCIAIDSIK